MFPYCNVVTGDHWTHVENKLNEKLQARLAASPL